MTTPIVFLPVDLTGSALSNFISSEFHQAAGAGQALIRPNFGDYYASGFQLYGVSGANSLTLLRHGQDYVHGHLSEQSTQASGMEVYQVVLVKNTQLFTTFSISYHAFGGQINNINYPRLYGAYLQARSGAITPYASLTGVPEFFEPTAHTHAAQDLFGMEYIVGFLNNLKTAMNHTRLSGAKYQEIRYALQGYVAERTLLDSQLPVAIRQHIDNHHDDHHYTKAVVGFGNVSNYAFTALTVNGVTLPAYASPATIGYWLANQPAATNPAHAAFTNNPHLDTKESIGLGLVSNLPVILNLDTDDYLTIYNPAYPETYVGPYVFAAGITQYGNATYAATTQPLITAALSTSTSQLSSANTILGTTSGIQMTVDAQVVSFQNSTESIAAVSEQAQGVNTNYTLRYGNALYCHTLVQVMHYDHTRFVNEQSIYPTGYMPVPELIGGLSLWLSAENPLNTLMQDIQGNLRVTRLRDMSRFQRVYSASANVAPILKASGDVAAGALGITAGKVFAFSPGLGWDKTTGAALRLKPGMTVIALVRTGSLGSRLTLLSAPNEVLDTGVYAFTPSSQVLAVRSGGLWSPLEAPVGSVQPHTSGIVIGSIGEASEASTWLASTSAIDTVDNPRGVVNNDSPWPALNYVGADLTRIGNANFGVANEGELAELLVYDRQLSVPEMTAVIEYLKLRYSNNTALSLDFSALNAF